MTPAIPQHDLCNTVRYFSRWQKSIETSNEQQRLPLKLILVIDAINLPAFVTGEPKRIRKLCRGFEELSMVVLGVEAEFLFWCEDDNFLSGDAFELFRRFSEILHMLEGVATRNIVKRLVGKWKSFSESFTHADLDTFTSGGLSCPSERFRADIKARDGETFL